MEDSDNLQQQLKKRARRRLVGAVFFASVVAIVLPMVMDHEPRQPVQDVEIRIPGQDDKPFAPRFAAAPPADGPATAAASAVDSKNSQKLLPSESAAVVRPAEKPLEKSAEKPLAKLVDKPGEKKPEKIPEPSPGKTLEKPAGKAAAKSPDKAPPVAPPAARPATENGSDGRRAADILAGKPAAGAAAAPVTGGQHVILIGAFSSAGNVKTLTTKLGELGIAHYTEPLDTPQGRKIRVRAGPFPSREAADKALARMQKIGVSGVVSPRS